MPFAEFTPSDAGARMSAQIAGNIELGQSLMDRAQRRQLIRQQMEHDATRFAADLATSNLQREEAQIALNQRRLDFQERERMTRLNADLRAGFDHAQFSAAVESIRHQVDPATQDGAVGDLRASYARFRTVPELARLMDEQLASLEPAIAANRESRLQERVSANRYALTPEDAAERFRGYRITPTLLPAGAAESGGRNHRLIYLAEDDVDPRLEAEAFQLLHTSSAWGDPRKLEALAQDPAVAAVLRVPGSKFATAYRQAVSAARASLVPRSAPAAFAPPIAPAGLAETALLPSLGRGNVPARTVAPVGGVSPRD